MPAVELARLRAQINGLIERFGTPDTFRSGLRDLLDLYTNHAYRAGQAAPPQPLLPSYRVPPLITRELELQLSKTCQELPEQALAVVEALWRDPYLEPRLLAAHLLGAIPLSQSTQILQKLNTWAVPTENFRMLEALFQNGTVTLRREAPELLLGLIEDWISSHRPDEQALGLIALIPLIGERSFENLPPVYRLLGPLLQNPPGPLYADLQATIEALINRSPTETAYFLRQILPSANGSSTARLVRRCLPLFSEKQQASLRAALQAGNLT